MSGVKPATVVLREDCCDLCHLHSDFANQQGPQRKEERKKHADGLLEAYVLCRVGVGLGAARRADTAPRLPSPRTSPRRTPSRVVACGSGMSDCIANRVLVKAKRACSTPHESLAANLLLCTDERIVIARPFVSQDP